LSQQNSLVETGPPKGQHLRDVGPRVATVGQGAEVATPGLQNEAGEYNCFLNVVIQCLWHCGPFRKMVMERAAALEAAGEVPRALVGLFRAFGAEARVVAETAAAGEQGAARPRQVVAPTDLRDALASLNKDDIRVGAHIDMSVVAIVL
jgi:ubiquitin C-terminal hydrolase